MFQRVKKSPGQPQYEIPTDQYKKGKLQDNLNHGFFCKHPKQNTRKVNLRPKITPYDQVYTGPGIQGQFDIKKICRFNLPWQQTEASDKNNHSW